MNFRYVLFLFLLLGIAGCHDEPDGVYVEGISSLDLPSDSLMPVQRIDTSSIYGTYIQKTDGFSVETMSISTGNQVFFYYEGWHHLRYNGMWYVKQDTLVGIITSYHGPDLERAYFHNYEVWKFVLVNNRFHEVSNGRRGFYAYAKQAVK